MMKDSCDPDVVAPLRESGVHSPTTLLVVGIILAALTEGIASTALSLGRGDIIGDTYATPDEFAWLDVGYTSFKLIAFMAAPWLICRFNPVGLLIGSTMVMGTACALAASTAQLDLLLALRIIQGFAGGTLLVVGQTSLFLTYSKRHQPILQALFAIGAVVAPATITPALQGWLLDNQSWTWIFVSAFPIALAAAGLLFLAAGSVPVAMSCRPPDYVGLTLFSTIALCFTYVLNQGNRWNWFDEPRVTGPTLLGLASLLLLLAQQSSRRRQGVLNFVLFRTENFSFAFIVSFVAGAALFGSAYLILSFAVSVLAITPTEAGQLLLPSGALFVCSLLLAAYLFQARGLSPFVTVPFGILLIIAAMWMLSGSTYQSGADDMMPAILTRGLGLGFLFLSINLIAFSDLDKHNLASGIGLFNVGRQFGGLMGVAGLQTLITHNVAANAAVFGASITAGTPEVSERLSRMSTMLVAGGVEAAQAPGAAVRLLGKLVIGQSTVIAFDTAFVAVTLLFVAAAPLLIVIRKSLSHFARPGSAVLDPTKSKAINQRSDNNK